MCICKLVKYNENSWRLRGRLRIFFAEPEPEHLVWKIRSRPLTEPEPEPPHWFRISWITFNQKTESILYCIFYCIFYQVKFALEHITPIWSKTPCLAEQRALKDTFKVQWYRDESNYFAFTKGAKHNYD